MTIQQSNIHVFSDCPSLFQAVADHVIEQGTQTIKAKGTFSIALSGGSTPKSLYALLASTQYRSRLDWQRVEFFWGDERHVPPDHPESNYRMAYETLLSPLGIGANRIHRIHGENPEAGTAAVQYEQRIRSRLGNASLQTPQLDLILLGMGPDGHTASLFPGTEAVHENTKWVTAPWVEKFHAFRITMTPALINCAHQVTFMVSGKEKAQVLKAVLEGEYQPDILPSQIIRPQSGRLTWFLDQEAAQDLSIS